MVRSISANAQAFLDQNIGTEPAIIIEIQWISGGAIYTYSDKDINADEGKILEVSGLDNTVVIQGVQAGTSGDSQQISITLDDTDGTIKDIIDANDIHKEQAWVYQWFQGLDLADKFLIFKGQISSPMQWNEGDRTVSFDIINRIEDVDVGFSMEEGNFEYVPEDLVGQPWPLGFGTVTECPALRTRTPRTGVLKTGFGIRDFVLAPKAEQIDEVCCPWVFVGFTATYDNFTAWGNSSIVIKPNYETDAKCLCKKRIDICDLELNLAEQIQYEYGTFQVLDGDLFPQGQTLVLDVGGARVSGQFNGTTANPSETFVIEGRTHPAKVDGSITVPPITRFGCDPPPDGSTETPASSGQPRCVIPEDCGGWGSQFSRWNSIVGGETTLEQEAWNYVSQFREAGFFWAEPGTEVKLADENELVYEVNLLPSTIHYVKAYRNFKQSGKRQLTMVPDRYYTTRVSNFNGYSVQEVVMQRPLSSRDEGWEDDIYVSYTSSVGNNMVDIMEWLITKYTSFSWDSSFASVKTKIDKYPMNFVVPGRKNILTLLQEMAFQNRCALTLRNDEFHLTYLAEEPAEDGTITDSDVYAKSLVLDHTDTEDLVTTFIAEWKPDCIIEDPYKVILRYNVKRYGSQEETFDFYCFNIQELVIKSATFWLIRMANTWRRIQCQVPISKLALESIDGCYVTLDDIADGQIKCRVEQATYNSDDNAIDLVLQTPVRAGTRVPFAFHYPANISTTLLHPTNQDIRDGIAGGSGPNVDVEAPDGHVLGGNQNTGFGGFSFGQKSSCETLTGATQFYRPVNLFEDCRPDHGDQQPSDQDDQKPEKKLEDKTGSDSQSGRSNLNENSPESAKIIENDYANTGADADNTRQTTNSQSTGTGSTDGAGTGDGAGSGGSEQTDAQKAKDYFDDMPDKEELEKQNRCYWGLRLNFIAKVTSVRIEIGQTCDPEKPPCNQVSLGFCYCSESGVTGCVVGNQSANQTEEFMFDTEAERDAAIPAFQAVIDSKATVGSSHPMFYTKFKYNPEGCIGPEGDSQGIIGHGYGGGNTGSTTVIGQDNFLVGEFEGQECNY